VIEFFGWVSLDTRWETCDFFLGGEQIGIRVVLFSSTDGAISFIMLELASHKPRMPLFHNVAACISQAKNAIVLSCRSLHFISQECPCRIFNSGMVIYVVLHEHSHCRLTRSMTIFHATFCNNLPPGLSCDRNSEFLRLVCDTDLLQLGG
jgi:hypothetical protein